MAHPDGNTTDVSILATELDGKRQEVLIEAVPGLRRMAALADTNTTPIAKLQTLQKAAAARNIALSIHRIAKGEEIAAAIDMAKGSGATALNVVASPMLFANRHLIIDSVAALGLPAIYECPEMAEEGGLVAYGPRLIDIFREIQARQLAQLFRGVKPADIPIEQPTEFELVINLKTAKALGIDDARNVSGTRRQGDRLTRLFAALRESVVGVRRGKAALSSGCKSHPATAPAGSNRSSHGGDEMAEAFGIACHDIR